MHSCCFCGQIINHVLVVLSHALNVVESFAVEGKSNSVGTIPYIKVLGPNSTHYPEVTDLDCIHIGRKQVIAIGLDDWKVAQEVGERSPNCSIDQFTKLD